MRALFLILADGATVAEGKLYLLGGGWTKVTVSALPTGYSAHLAVGLEVPWNETEQRHSFIIGLTSEGDDNLSEIVEGEFEVGRPPEVPEGDNQTLLLAMPLALQLGEQPGRYRVRLLVDGNELGHTQFVVQRRQ